MVVIGLCFPQVNYGVEIPHINLLHTSDFQPLHSNIILKQLLKDPRKFSNDYKNLTSNKDIPGYIKQCDSGVMMPEYGTYY